MTVRHEHQVLLSKKQISNKVRSITTQLPIAILFNVKKGKTALLLMHWWLETNLKLIFSTKQKPFSICYKRSTRNCIPYWQLSLFSNITQRWRSTVNCAALILFWPFRQKITLVHAQLQLFHELFWSRWVKIRSRDLCSNLSKD